MIAADGHVWSGSFDGLVRVTRRGGQPLHEARGHASSVHALAEGVEAVFSAGGDFLIRAWSTSLVPLRTLRAHTGAIHALAAPIPSPSTYGYTGEAFSAGGAGVWSGADDAALHVWSGSEADGFEHVTCIEDFTSAVRVLAEQNANPPRVWAADAAGALRVYDARSRSVLRTCISAGTAPATTCIVSTPSTAVWVGDESGGVTIYDGTSLTKLQRLDGVHTGAVVSLVCPKAGLGSPGGGEAAVGGIVVWSYGADISVRGWGMSEKVSDRLSSAREAIDGQHSALTMMRSMLPRAAAAAAGRLEAAAQRSEILTRRLLDVEVSMSVGGQIGGLYESGAAGGMPPPAITDISDGYHPGYPLSACNLPMTPSRRDHQNGAAAAMSEAAAQERSRQYQESVEALHASQREIAGDVEEALLALRGRIDEILHFAQGGGQTEATARAAAAELAGANGAPTAGWPALAAPSPRRTPAKAASVASAKREVRTPVWAAPSPRGPLNRG